MRLRNSGPVQYAQFTGVAAVLEIQSADAATSGDVPAMRRYCRESPWWMLAAGTGEVRGVR